MRTWSLVTCLAGATILGGMALGDARADFQTGGTLLQNCEKAGDDIALAYCVGYITGIADAIGNGDEEISYWQACLPENTSQGEIFEKLKTWLAEHPQNADVAASDNIAHGLATLYPCN
ncbi:MAG TPA: Rap1a/Tai family immunity protein [Kiloniellaceae bacterium]|nr:Rap1a/Tai family immunity protein [Kiloniellaceae bacterium]